MKKTDKGSCEHRQIGGKGSGIGDGLGGGLDRGCTEHRTPGNTKRVRLFWNGPKRPRDGSLVMGKRLLDAVEDGASRAPNGDYLSLVVASDVIALVFPGFVMRPVLIEVAAGSQGA